MHVHTYNHLLTLTTATMTDRAPRQPWVHGSPDAHELAYHVPQVYRSIHGRSCRALPRRLPRWPAGLQQPLHLAARARHRRQRRWRVLQCVVCPWSALGGVRGPRGGRVAAEWLRRMRGMRMPISAARDRGHGKPRAAPRWVRAGWARPGGAPGSLWGGPRRHRPKVGPVMGACTCASVPGLVWESWEIYRDCISGGRDNGELSRFLCVI